MCWLVGLFVLMVCCVENGRAYPDYLVRYYVGKRDPRRSPYEDRAQAMNKSSLRWKSSSFHLVPEKPIDRSSNDDGGQVSSVANWEFEGASGWTAYDGVQAVAIETCYRAVQMDPTSPASVVVKGPEWSYAVNVRSMTQTNISHPDRKRRRIRRLQSVGSAPSPFPFAPGGV